MCFRQPDIARAAQVKTAHTLRQRPLHPGTLGKGIRLFAGSGGLQRFRERERPLIERPADDGAGEMRRAARGAGQVRHVGRRRHAA